MTLIIPELIRQKRDNKELQEDHIRQIIGDYTAGRVPDYQMAALLMAIYFNGLTPTELSAWTDAMLHSGGIMDHSNVPGRKVDKHSTGGVGDKISICLAPAVAALGVPVPMISGRGLGHTGGTLDKLESIPGFDVSLSPSRSNELLQELNMFLVGQTEDIAPADRKLYALRDVTGTVESIPLISSSIMSKKLAEGIDGLVLDVKFGDGAFMDTAEKARELAQTLISIGKNAGKQVKALLTDMNSPIGYAVGNALETREAIHVMQGKGPEDTRILTMELGAQMLLLGGAVTSAADGLTAMKSALSDNSALDLFARCIERQGGNPNVCHNPDLLPRATKQTEITASRSGIVHRIHPRHVAIAALHVGAGRLKKEDPIDPATGVELLTKVGDAITAGTPLALIHHNDRGEQQATQLLNQAFTINDAPASPILRVKERIG